jgi:hypothetical protein
MKIVTGRKVKPVNLMIYAEHGLGKTTLPSEANNPIYVGSEENDEFDIARMPKVEKWKDLEEQLAWLLKEKHDYKTLVIDTMDALEQVAQKDILKAQSGKTMATAFGGYGKAYEKMADMFLDIRDDYLVKLRDIKGMNIVILAHAEKSKHEDPMTMTSYDHYSTAIHKKIKPIFEDWVSAILFISYKVYKTQSNDGREHAIGDGSRMIYTEQRPSHVAKNRFELPYEIEFEKTGTWKTIIGHIKSHYGNAQKFVKSEPEKESGMTMNQINEGFKEEAMDASEATPPETNPNAEYIQICKAIDEIFPKVSEDAKDKIRVSIERAKTDVKELTRIYNKMQKLTK